MAFRIMENLLMSKFRDHFVHFRDQFQSIQIERTKVKIGTNLLKMFVIKEDTNMMRDAF